MDISFILNKPPEEIINWFKAKGYRLSWDWWETWQEAHAKAFTVAKVMKMDILQDIRDMVQEAKEEGIPFSQFKKELEPRLKAKGWWGRTFQVDEDGNIKKVWLGTPWRLKTIFQTNLQSAYMSGRYKALLENVDDRPYWQYIAVLDASTRPSHRMLHGKVFRFDDPFWESHFPPNGFNCRCRVRALSRKNLQDRNLSVESSAGKLKKTEQIISRKTGEVRPAVKYIDPVTGESMTPDPGWNYNPGKAAFFPDLDKYDYDVAVQWVQGGLTGPDFKAFYEGKIKGNFPVAIIEQKFQHSIGSKSQVVYLSDYTLTKNKNKHPDVEFYVYQKIPDIIMNAKLIVKDGPNTFVFLKIDNNIYYGAIKTTGTGKTNFLVSLRRAREKDIEKIKQKGEILKNEL